MNIITNNFYQDRVIKSIVLSGETNYEFAINKIFPLIDRFQSQRKLLDFKFYERLERDILKECIMPPITLAFIRKEEKELTDLKSISEYINTHISEGYILDGIQRLNTLKRANDREDVELNLERPLLVNIIIAKNPDMLLYRMITLNNGQKPMSPRHQIEILTRELFKFEDLTIDIQSEKERSEQLIRGAFNLGDISKGYLAFLTGKVHNENNKIINEKMDQILVERIFDSNITESSLTFEEVLEVIDNLSTNELSKKWLKTANNLIGFCVGIKNSYKTIVKITAESFGEKTDIFEAAFKAVNPSKVNLGKYRRELSEHWIKNMDKFSEYGESELTETFINVTAS